MPFASIWLGLGLALTSIIGSYRLTLKNVCRARHTTWRCTRTEIPLRSIAAGELGRWNFQYAS